MSKHSNDMRRRQDGQREARYGGRRSADGIREARRTKLCSKAEKKASLAGRRALPSKERKRTFGDVLNLWMDNNRLRLKGGTINKYQSLIDTHIMPELGAAKIADLSAIRINRFLENKISRGRVDGFGGLSSAYVRSIMLVINAAMKYAVNEQFCPPLRNPICKPSVEKKELAILSRDDQRQLEAALLRSSDTMCAGIYLSLHTGLRIGEVCALAWSDIDLEQKAIHIRHTVARIRENDSTRATVLIIDSPKTKASKRDIPISSALLPILLHLKNLSGEGFLLTGTQEFAKPRTLAYRFRKTLEACGIPPVNYHALRHTFATRCVEAGVDIKSLSEILGHGNVGVTLNTYVHSSLEMKRMQLEKLAALSQ